MKIKRVFNCENCGFEFTDRQNFSGSIGASYNEVCEKCGMTTIFTLVEANDLEHGYQGVDVYQELQIGGVR